MGRSVSASAGIKDWEFWQYTDKPIDQNWGSPHWQTKDDLRAWTLQDPDTPIFWSDTWKSEYLAFGGSAQWITPIDKTILIACAQASGWGSVRIVQGGLRPHTSFSGWTHNGLGVGDIGIDGRSKAEVGDFCAHLRRSGIQPFPAATAATRGRTRSIFISAAGNLMIMLTRSEGAGALLAGPRHQYRYRSLCRTRSLSPAPGATLMAIAALGPENPLPRGDCHQRRWPEHRSP
jgi:hypothetical protein